MRARLFLAFALCVAACKGPPADFQPVQDSAKGTPRASVSLNRIIAGRYRAISPSCIGQQYTLNVAPGTAEFPRASGLSMRPEQIVEFRNYQPDVSTNVTSLSSPSPLFSPNLVRPYNVATESGETYSYWRYAFPKPGVYEYFDTNMGSPGRQVVDSYYGTVTYVGESNAPKAVVCVDPPNCQATPECLAGTAPEGTVCCACVSVCCVTDDQCTTDKTCLRGRCVDRETGE
ncbi:hypothetical protein ACN28E_29090 [Archangium lansingense]|uniref:hypothetical protein n=1 Tax=Archangium lansingense TaxID=2995310 RepID=UPI003B7DBFE9